MAGPFLLPTAISYGAVAVCKICKYFEVKYPILELVELAGYVLLAILTSLALLHGKRSAHKPDPTRPGPPETSHKAQMQDHGRDGDDRLEPPPGPQS